MTTFVPKMTAAHTTLRCDHTAARSIHTRALLPVVLSAAAHVAHGETRFTGASSRPGIAGPAGGAGTVQPHAVGMKTGGGGDRQYGGVGGARGAVAGPAARHLARAGRQRTRPAGDVQKCIRSASMLMGSLPLQERLVVGVTNLAPLMDMDVVGTACASPSSCPPPFLLLQLRTHGSTVTAQSRTTAHRGS
jgi:hypothetical protein